MAYTAQFSEETTLVDKINYGTVTNASVNSLGVNMANVERVVYKIEAINMGAAGTIDARLQGSAASNFSTVTNLTGTNITQMTTNNTTTWVEIRSDQLAQAKAGLQYVRLNLTGGGNAVTCIVYGEGKDCSQRPASAFNLNTSYLAQQLVCNI